MESRISFVQKVSCNKSTEKVLVHVEGEKSAVLDLLSLGTRSIMETLNISLYEYLEALMEAKELPLSERVIIDTSLINRQENGEVLKSD